MGFGHRVYKVKDPRATVLQELAENVFRRDVEAAGLPARAGAGEGRGRGTGAEGDLPNVDFFSGIVYQSLGIPRDCSPDLRHRRVAGCSLTGSSSSRTTASSRPEQIYVGKHNVAYVPLEKRP